MQKEAMNLFATLMTALLAVATACTPSAVIDGGCELAGGSGVAVHYRRNGSEVTFALRSRTEGYVGISFMPVSQIATFPADAVVGSSLGDARVLPLQINMETTFISSGVKLANASVSKVGEFTELQFTRALMDARFYLDPRKMCFRVASGPFDALAFNNSSTLVFADLSTGYPEAVAEPVVAQPPPVTVPVAVGQPRTSSYAREMVAGYAVACSLLGVLAST